MKTLKALVEEFPDAKEILYKSVYGLLVVGILTYNKKNAGKYSPDAFGLLKRHIAQRKQNEPPAQTTQADIKTREMPVIEAVDDRMPLPENNGPMPDFTAAARNPYASDLSDKKPNTPPEISADSQTFSEPAPNPTEEPPPAPKPIVVPPPPPPPIIEPEPEVAPEPRA